MAKPELTWWTVDVTNDAGTSGDTYHLEATDAGDAERIALKVSPDLFTVVTSVEPGVVADVGVVVERTAK